MSRTSRVPYHQNVYDLLLIDPRPLAGRREMIREWEQQTGRRFPSSLVELYSIEAAIPFGVNAKEQWVLPMTEVWHQYSNMEEPTGLEQVLEPLDRPHSRVVGEIEPGPYHYVQCENQGNWLMYARANGDDDPPTYATDGGPYFLRRQQEWREGEWCRLGQFSEVLFRWFAWYYHDLDREIGTSFVPLRFHGNESMPEDDEFAPPKPYHNGLWLRTPAEPFAPPVIDFLTEQLGEPERTPRPGSVTTYTFRPPGGTIRVTADDPALAGGLSAWWLHADSPGRLTELARLVMPFGTLRDTLRADTDAAREAILAVS
ncbi:MAG TPA: hypothetical protein VM529_26670 [Gemmata sp.]|nr:hypothetical protein [Gemmata sp.]